MPNPESSSPSNDAPVFSGFGRRLFSFFDALAKNQNKKWFHAHKDEYETQAHIPMQLLVEALSARFATQSIALSGSAKTSLLRINRDLRFSKDKDPYKTNISAVLSETGTKMGRGALYLQMGGPDGAFAAMGFYSPEPAQLKTIRGIIADEPEQWMAIEAGLKSRGLSLMQDDTLSRMPKGFESHADTPVAETLKLKSFVVKTEFTKKSTHEEALVDRIATFADDGWPLINFFRDGL
jgi:uncharacterized protein (TIGR02453 family)